MRWVYTAGGPFVLVPTRALKHWSGADAPPDGRTIEATFRWNDPNDPATDYDRACDVHEYAEVIAVGDDQAVVFGDEPMQVTWLPVRDGGVLARWGSAESEGEAARMLLAVDEVAFAGPALKWAVPKGGALLFDSAYPGAGALAEQMSWKLTLPAGNYEVHTEWWAPIAKTTFVLHRFTRRAPARRKSPAKRAGARRTRR